MVVYCTGSNPIEIGDLGSKVKVTVTQYPFFLHNFLLTCLLYISALLCLIKWNLICRLDIPLVDLCSISLKIEWVMTSLWRHLSFLQTIVHFVLGTNTQQHNVHLIMIIKVILTEDEGHRRRSKVTKNELIVIFRKLLNTETTYLVPRYNTISDI